MKNKENLVIGFSLLLVIGGMNFSYALSGYGYFDGSLCQNILAQSSSSGIGSSSSGSSSSSSSSSGSSSGLSSADGESDKFKIYTQKTKTEENGVTTKESVITDCDKGGDKDCQESTVYRYKKEDGSWSEWIPT